MRDDGDDDDNVCIGKVIRDELGRFRGGRALAYKSERFVTSFFSAEKCAAGPHDTCKRNESEKIRQKKQKNN